MPGIVLGDQVQVAQTVCVLSPLVSMESMCPKWPAWFSQLEKELHGSFLLSDSTAQ